MDFCGFSSIWVLGRFLWIWVPSGSKTALSGVVNPELQFPFQEKEEKVKKPRKIKGLKRKNELQLGHLVTTSQVRFLQFSANSRLRPEAGPLHSPMYHGANAVTLGVQGLVQTEQLLTPMGMRNAEFMTSCRSAAIRHKLGHPVYGASSFNPSPKLGNIRA